eukprot:4228242-Alexandrium_andersonii.AAC.1
MAAPKDGSPAALPTPPVAPPAVPQAAPTELASAALGGAPLEAKEDKPAALVAAPGPLGADAHGKSVPPEPEPAGAAAAAGS